LVSLPVVASRVHGGCVGGAWGGYLLLAVGMAWGCCYDNTCTVFCMFWGLPEIEALRKAAPDQRQACAELQASRPFFIPMCVKAGAR
jgi:hypothetical protein